MNDFTKEEFECLHNAIELQLKKNYMSQINCDRRKELLNKIQSMIDNYCEHTNQYTGSGIFVYCDDCDKVFI